jgi:WD40 repeat protein
LTLDEQGTSALGFSPDGKLLATVRGNADLETVRFWDLATGREARRLTVSSRNDLGVPHYTALSFSPDGRMLALVNSHEEILIVSIPEGKTLCKLRGRGATAFSPDGKLLAFGDAANSICLHDIALGKTVSDLPGHIGTITSLLFSPDGNLLVSGSADHTILLWDVRRGK